MESYKQIEKDQRVCSALVGVWAPSFFLSCVITVYPSPTSRHLSLFLVSVCAAGIPTLALFVHARGGGWKPDHVAFAVLVKMFGEAGDYDGIHFVFKEMQEVGLKPNIFVYNAQLKVLGKTSKPVRGPWGHAAHMPATHDRVPYGR
jgi:pentatricopeptide repeat protein